MKKLILTALVCVPGAVFAQTAQQNLIHVTGLGEVRVEPDIATFTFGITGQTDDPQLAKRRADTIAGELVERLEDLGIESTDIRSTPVTLNPFVDRPSQRELIRFNRTTTVVLRELDRFEDVERAALETGVNTVGGITFGVANEQELMDRARDLALDDARRQADRAAAHLGIAVGRVQSVNLSRPRGFSPQPMMRAFEASAADVPEANFRSGTIEINVDVGVAYEILQP